ncbi:hypothetical protein [Heliothis virescens ascovirus 3e]|uniref:Uncharacterized protein n=1 Tax=Heliothis virescens ascovirus 3e TaxID=260797 RepID=A4KXF8_HVAVE|nr:hypothetical protein HVAV3e_gp102 [Heliothis virescens ascovirus 3e]ABO37289.1 hypothetical protein [Heliothis virescens ascovirus 3e]
MLRFTFQDCLYIQTPNITIAPKTRIVVVQLPSEDDDDGNCATFANGIVLAVPLKVNFACRGKPAIFKMGASVAHCGFKCLYVRMAVPSAFISFVRNLHENSNASDPLTGTHPFSGSSRIHSNIRGLLLVLVITPETLPSLHPACSNIFDRGAYIVFVSYGLMSVALRLIRNLIVSSSTFFLSKDRRLSVEMNS